MRLTVFLLFLGLGVVRADEPVTLHPTMHYTAGWIGNSINVVHLSQYGDKTEASYEYVQKDGNGLAVAPDGTCYVTSGWDEGGKGLGIYKNGKNAGACQGISIGGAAVAVDDKYIYACTPKTGSSSPPAFTISRWKLDGSPSKPGFPPTINTMPGGIVSFNNAVYVADPATNTIHVFDRDLFIPQRSFPCDQPFRMTADADGKLWIIHRPTTQGHGVGFYLAGDPNSPASVSQFDPVTGKPTGKTIDNLTGATAVAVTPENILLVAGPNNQVQKYNISGAQPVLVGALGVKNGVYSNPPGQMAPDRLFGLWGVGCDTNGNIYTLGRLPDVGTGFDLRSFSKDGKLNWAISSVGFTDNVGVDPSSDGLDVYTRSIHFALDPSQPPGRQFSWVGYTLDPSYDDGRVTDRASGSGFIWDAPMIRRLQGRLYMYLHPGPYLGIFRQGAGEMFLPSGMISLAAPWLIGATTGDHGHDLDWPPQQPMVAGQAAPAGPGMAVDPSKKSPVPTRSRWVWRDTNGDGKIQPSEMVPDRLDELEFISDEWVDMKGDIWLVGDHSTIRHLPMQGFDAQKNPIYSWDKQIKLKAPPELGEVLRIVYDSNTDTMYLSGTPPGFTGKLFWNGLGTLIIRYDNWSKGNPVPKWKIPIAPSDGDLHFPAFAVAGDRIFVMQRFWSRIWVYNGNDGSYVGLITTTPETGTSGWCDMTHGIEAFQRKDGSYFVFAEDDYRPKIRFYVVPRQPQPSPPLPLPSVSEP